MINAKKYLKNQKKKKKKDADKKFKKSKSEKILKYLMSHN